MNKKRKVTKRIVAWFLCLAMVLTTVNLPAFSIDVKAAETVRSTITIDGKEYYLYTGFNAIEGTGYHEAHNYEALVDGDMESWYLDDGGYVEFSSILPIALKGYVFDSMDPEANPSSWTLKAKANEEDDWNVVSSRSDDISSGTNFSFACDNQENKVYRYFRFEMEGEYVALSEIRLYGGKEFYYFLPQKSATCTETGIKQACYLGGDGKYFADETGTNELLAEDVIAPIVPHTLEDDTAHVSTCTVCGQTIITSPHIFLDENGETRDCICGELNPDHNHGYCGDPEVNDGKDVAWRVTQEEDGNYTLTISGTGRMANFQSNWDEPWNKAGNRDYLDKITKAVISDGVTYVGRDAFFICPGLKTVEIPSSVTAIGNAAFGDCDALAKVEMPCSLDYSSSWWGNESAFVKYHVYEGQPFVDGEDGTHHQKCKCGNESTTPENHNFSDQGDGTHICADCGVTEKHDFLLENGTNNGAEKCTLCNVKNITSSSLDIKATSTTYTGKEQTAVIIGVEAKNFTVTGNTATNAGKYTITLTGKGDYTGTREVEWTIMKATPTVVPPTSANPKYAGESVKLVNPGSTDFGKMIYSLGDDDYSEEIPCADKGGDYTVYYEVEGSDNWSGAAGSVEIQVPVRVDVTVVGNGSVSGYDPDEFYPVGTVLTLTAEPDEDYRFTGWDDDIDAPAERVWTVLADAKDNELTVNFQHKNHDFDDDGVCKVCEYECTHKNEGVSTFVEGKCSICNYNCVAKEHVNNTNNWLNKNATEHEFACSVCGIVVKGNHDFSQSEYKTDVAGKHYQICALCQTPSEKVDCTAGTPVREKEVAATCTEDGSYDEVTYCTVCKQELSRVNKTIIKTGHKFTTYTSNDDATCTENATETATCENEDCGETDTREVVNSALGHDYAAEYKVDTTATCTTAGSKSKHCSRCETKTDVTVIPATGEHTYEDGFCSSCQAAWTKTENGFIYTAVVNEAGPSVSVKVTEDVVAENGKLVIPDKVSDGTTEFAVTEIAEKAFENVTGVTEVIIPETVETIGSKAFENEEIKKIDFEGTEAPIMAEDALGTNVTEISVPENATGYEQADALANVIIVKPSASPSPSEEVSASPEPSEEVSASPQPSEEVSASPSPSNVPSEKPSDEPSVSPSPSEEVSASPEPSEEVSVSPSPSEEVSASPSPSNVPIEKPSDEPSVSPEPSEEVSASPSPSEEVSASPSPSEEVSASPSPSNVPSEKPSDEPSVSPEPSEEVSASPEPSEEVSTSPQPSEEVSVSPSPSEEVSVSPQPSEEVSASPQPSEEVSTSPVPSTSSSVSPSVVPTTSPSIVPSVVPSTEPSKAPAVGDVAADQSTNGNYQVTAADTAKKEVTYTKPVNKQKTSYKIPDTVKIDGVVYKITKIEKNAFKNNAKVKTIVAGKNIKSIGANAFKGCKKLKTLTIKSTKLTSSSVAKNAFKGITKATTIKVPKKKLKAYKALFQKKGLSKSVKIKAI